jgi:hypothetical protein
MGAGRLIACVFIPLFCVPTAAQGDGKADARRAVERCVKALGGDGKPSRYKAALIKVEGVVHLGGRPVNCRARIVYQPPLQYCLTIEGYDLKAVTVLNGDRGWVRLNRESAAMTREEVAEQKEALHAERVAGLLSVLGGKGFELSPLGAARIDGQEVVGVRVAHKGHRDVKLYFSRKSGLLVKMEARVKEKGKMQTQETFFSDYQEIGGSLRPRRVVSRRDKKEYVSWEVVEYKALEKRVAEEEFARP